jgi:hypothetical protein
MSRVVMRGVELADVDMHRLYAERDLDALQARRA